MRIEFTSGLYLDVPYSSYDGIILDGKNLHRAILESLTITNGSFVNADLRGAYLSNSILRNCEFERACLITAYLNRAVVEFSDFRHCHARWCNFQFAELKSTNFEAADVHGADFSNCKLLGCIMTCKNMEMAEWKDTTYDDLTVWPASFNPDDFGCLRIKI